MEKNVVHGTHSDYYQLHEINSIISTKQISKKLALYHVNTDSLDKHFDDLRTVLANVDIAWDIIGISEIGEQLGGFKCNIDLDGYHFIKQNSKTKKGGVGLYVDNKLDHFERDDLRMQDDLFETVWVEIVNRKSKNALCCCAYHHPNTEPTRFYEYFEHILSKISKEKKQIFILGDFNFDLLKYRSDSEHTGFLTFFHVKWTSSNHPSTHKSNYQDCNHH